jgi:DNA-binding SARP family transcriptional activator
VTLSIALIGPPKVEVDGLPLEVDTRKAVALLAYLALEREPQPRDRIVDLLWPDSGVDRARSSLRRTLSALRSGLGGRWVDADRSFVTIESDQIDLDARRLEAITAPHLAHPDGEPCATCLAELGAVTTLDRGAFMDGFAVRGAPDFEMWMTTQAERVSQQVDGAYARLAASHARSGDYLTASSIAEKRLEIDPLRESAYRDLMLFKAWEGDRSGAVDVYRRAVATLDRELGVPPLDETTELYEAILEEDLPRAPAPQRRRPAVEVPAEVPLVGRSVEIDSALAALEEPGSVVFVEGVAGIGVTRFLGALTARLGSRFSVRTAGGSESGRAIPYGVINQALFDLVDSPKLRPAVDALPTSVRDEASRIFPILGTPPPESTPARFLDALARLVATLPEPLIVVDDLHLSDPASLDVLDFLAERASRIDLRLVLGSTKEAGDADRADAVDDLRQRAAVIRLTPLDRDAVAAYAAAARIDIDPDRLLAETGGLPFLLDAASASRGQETASQRHLIDRLDGLDGTSRQVYESIAVLDGWSEPSLVAAVSGRTSDETDEATDRLVKHGLVVETDSGNVMHAHGLMARAATDRLSAARRRLLHRRAARALEERGAVTPGRIARHHRLAGDDDSAAEWHRTAGDAAAAAFAYSEAVQHFEAALASGHPDRAGLHRAIATSALLAGEYDRAIGEFEAALAAGDPEPAVVEHRLGELMRRLQRWDLAAAHYDRAAEAGPDTELVAVIAADRAYVEHRRAGSTAARPMVERAVALAEASGSDRALARSRNIAGLVAASAEERRTHLEAALASAHHAEERIAVLNNLAAAADGDAAVDYAGEGLELATAVGDRHLMAALGNTLADALHASGDTSAAQTALARAVALFAEVSAGGDEPWTPEVWFLTEW